MKLTDLFNVSETGTEFSQLKGVFAGALEKVREQKKNEALETVAGFLSDFSSQRDRGVTQLREIRKQEKRQKELVAKQDRALKYFMEVGDPMPFAWLVGMQRRVASRLAFIGVEVDLTKVAEVPADWK